MLTAEEILDRLRCQANPENAAGMARYGISPEGLLGVSVPELRDIAKELRPDRKTDPAGVHALAGELWESGVHEARMLAGFIDVPTLVTADQMEAWAADFDSWDICDQVCGNLFDRTPFAYEKGEAWAARDETFVKRAGFVLMTQLAVHDKKAPDEPFLHFLTLVEREAGDDRNFVKKAVNWALRQIGKRNATLWPRAVATARRLRESDSKAARWIASDALRELESDKIRARLGV